MTQINAQRMTVELEGDFVVFLIGMRINKPWKVHKWLPTFLAMPRMLKELKNRPESGLLGYFQQERRTLAGRRRHLARDVPRGGGPVRGSLLGHALGLATVGKLVPVSGARDSARERIEAAVLTSAR
jgi:hypothetical protein